MIKQMTDIICKVCELSKYMRGNGYCAKHSTSGEAYLEDTNLDFKSRVEEIIHNIKDPQYNDVGIDQAAAEIMKLVEKAIPQLGNVQDSSLSDMQMWEMSGQNDMIRQLRHNLGLGE